MNLIVNAGDKLRRLELENAWLRAQLIQAQADLTFVAVMADVDLPDMDEEEDGENAYAGKEHQELV